MTIANPATLHLAPNFDRLACLYRWMEWSSFGPFLTLCRHTYLPEVLSCRRALILGDGDGRFTARLLRSNPEIEVDAIDVSPAMLQALAIQVDGNSSRLHMKCLDARDWQPCGEKYDLIVTHFFLDCLRTEEVLALADRVRSAATNNAIWVLSEFAVPEDRFGQLVAAPIIKALYIAFGWMTGLTVRQLPDHNIALRSANFTKICAKSQLWGLLSSELWVHDT